MNWYLRALLRKTLESLPIGSQICRSLHNASLPGHFTHVPAVVEIQALQILRCADVLGDDLSDAVIIEFGSGWSPNMPALLFASGCTNVTMTDLKPLRNDRILRLALPRIVWSLMATPGLADKMQQRFDGFLDRLVSICRADSYEGFLRNTGYKYMAGVDATDISTYTHLNPEAVLSTNTLEHIPKDGVPRMLSG